MRHISEDDLHRLILTQAADPATLSPWKVSNPMISGRLKLHLDIDIENKIVSSVLSNLSYQNRERISRLISRLTEWQTGESKVLDLLNFWASIGDKYFDFVETFYVKPTLWQAWRRFMHATDEDLPALAWLSLVGDPDGKTQTQSLRYLFPWPTFIRGNDPQLLYELEKGFGCLHLHLSGSYPAPYFWIGLMNKRFDESSILDQSDAKNLRGYRSEEDIKGLVQLIQLGRKCRGKLFKYSFGRNSEDALNRPREECDFLFTSDEEEINSLDKFTDYAQDDVHDWSNSICPSLIGERYLLLRTIRAIQKVDDPVAEMLSKIFWAYIVCKNKYLNTIQQAEGVAGFDYFEHTFRLLRWRVPEQELICADEIGSFLQESGSLVKLELMISPQENAADYQSDITLATKILNRLTDLQTKKARENCGKPRVGLIVHFIKDNGEPLKERLTSSDDGKAYRAYHHTARDRVLNQFEVIAKHVTKDRGEVTICGIDAANRELYCPPEVFSEVFLKALPELRHRSPGRSRPIGRTFHVGEDFVHIGTGLRRIFEALLFLDLKPGDRLGHASALGLNPVRWAELNPTIEMHLIDILDDAVFETMILQNYAAKISKTVDEQRLSELRRLIDECCVSIFGNTIPFVHLEKAWKLRAKTSRNGATNFGDEKSVPKWVRLQNKRDSQLPIKKAGSHSLVMQVRDLGADPDGLPGNIAERIAIEYQHDIRTIHRFLEMRTVNALDSIEHVSNLQIAVAHEANERGIVIESNPSSNWLIAGLENHTEIPAVRWLAPTEVNSARVLFTINPDDPTVFATSIENEYFTVFAASVYSAKMLSRVDCLREISAIRERSLQASFLD